MKIVIKLNETMTLKDIKEFKNDLNDNNFASDLNLLDNALIINGDIVGNIEFNSLMNISKKYCIDLQNISFSIVSE